MWPKPQETADLVTFTEEILNEKLHFLCSADLGNLISLSCNSQTTWDFISMLSTKLALSGNYFTVSGFFTERKKL